MELVENSPWTTRALAALRDAGHPLTNQRVAIVRFLEENEAHPSASDVGAAVPDASRATVYKTLSLLVRMGLCDSVPSPTGELRFDPRTDDHDHAWCTSCGRLFDLEPGSVRVNLPHGFAPARHRVVVEGRCATCG